MHDLPRTTHLRRGACAASVLAAMLAGGCREPLEPDDEPEPEPDPVWDQFVAERDDFLRDLSEPIAECVAMDDTDWPAFHGCIDWHSAVHGTWALHALSRVLGDESFLAIAEETLDPEAVALELDLLEAGTLDWDELPYGFSWFLALARERERAGMTDLAPLGQEVAGRLEEHVFEMSQDEMAGGLLAAQYDNLSWELLNLWAWADHVQDDELQGMLLELVRDEVLPVAPQCPIADTVDDVYDFFPPCLHLARLLLVVLPEAEAAAWLADNLPAEFDLEPLDSIPGFAPHRAGLNFSRAWGLWSIWETSGDVRYRDLYVEHVEAHMAMPEYWADGYESYAHWVAQFGVYAIVLSEAPGEVP